MWVITDVSSVALLWLGVALMAKFDLFIFLYCSVSKLTILWVQCAGLCKVCYWNRGQTDQECQYYKWPGEFPKGGVDLISKLCGVINLTKISQICQKKMLVMFRVFHENVMNSSKHVISLEQDIMTLEKKNYWFDPIWKSKPHPVWREWNKWNRNSIPITWENKNGYVCQYRWILENNQPLNEGQGYIPALCLDQQQKPSQNSDQVYTNHDEHFLVDAAPDQGNMIPNPEINSKKWDQWLKQNK